MERGMKDPATYQRDFIFSLFSTIFFSDSSLYTEHNPNLHALPTYMLFFDKNGLFLSLFMSCFSLFIFYHKCHIQGIVGSEPCWKVSLSSFFAL